MADYRMQLAGIPDLTVQAPDAGAMALQGFGFGQEVVQGQQRMGLLQNADARAQEQIGMERERLAIDQQGAAMQQQAFTQEQQDRVAMVARAKEAQAAFAGLYDKIEEGTATAADFAAIKAAYPELTEGIDGVVAALSQDEKARYTSMIYRAGFALKSGKPEVAAALFEEHAAAAANSGNKMEADLATVMVETIRQDPTAALGSMGMFGQALGADINEELFKDAKPVEEKALQSSVTLADGTAVMTFTDGTRRVADAGGNVLEGQAAIEAVRAAQEYETGLARDKAAGTATGRLTTEAQLGGEAAAATEAGKQAITKSAEAYDSLSKINQNIVTIDTAIAAIDAGANSGAIAKYFPNITGASAELENAMNRLGLDVIGSVTFGALSEGEMRLAMETAVPRNLGEKDLRAWLERKKAAQEKASDALYNAAVYLGTPGNTLAKWLTEKRKPGASTADGSGSQTGAGGPAAGQVQLQGQEANWFQQFGGN